jgi:chromosome segregation ATPase
MAEMTTPEIITIAIASLAALTFLMLLITIASLSRVKKHLLAIAGRSIELEERHEALRQSSHKIASNSTTGLAEAADKITSIELRLDGFDDRILESQKIGNSTEVAQKIASIELRLDGFDNKIAESRNQLTGHESKLNEHDTLLGQAGQMIGKNALGFTQTIQRIQTLEDKVQDLKAFQSTFEQTRNRILDALGAKQAKIPAHNTLTVERKAPEQEAPIPSEERAPNTEGFHKSRLHR